MKALSIKQPWVYAILHEGKDIENRSWNTAYRGWLALHASGRPNRYAIFPRGVRVTDLHTLDYSAICGVAGVLDVVPNSRSKWFEHPDDGATNYGWVLGSVTALRFPIRCNGGATPKIAKGSRNCHSLWSKPAATREWVRRKESGMSCGSRVE